MTQPTELQKQLDLLNFLATAIKSSSSVDAKMKQKLTQLAEEIEGFITAVKADENANSNPENVEIAKAIFNAIVDPSDDNRKILRKKAKDTYYEAISYRIEAFIAETKKVLQPQLLTCCVEFMIYLMALATMGSVIGTVISIAATVYIDVEMQKHTPEELAKKEMDARKTSTAFYKAHGLLTKVGNTKIDDTTRTEIRDKIKHAPRR